MKKQALSILAYSISSMTSLVGQGVSIEPPVIPPPEIWVSNPRSKPMEIQDYQVSVEVRGGFASVETQMRFYNPNLGADLEGELRFPLPDRAVVSGYALDINGVLVDGVVVPKEQARVVFETEKRRKVDPGLVEHVKGNVYNTRIYPIPGQGTRTIRLTYVTPLYVSIEGDAALSLPMPRQKMGRRKVGLKVWAPEAARPVLSGLGDTLLAQAEGFWEVSKEEQEVTPEADILLAMPKLPTQWAMVESEADVEDSTVWAAIWVETSNLKPKALAEPKEVSILWDASGSRQTDDCERALAVIAALPETIERYRLVVFRDQVEAPQTYTNRTDLLTALRTVRYDGGTDFAALTASIEMSPQSRCLLFTDGIDTLSSQPAEFGDVDVTAFVSGQQADLGYLRMLCQQCVIDLRHQTPQDVVQQWLSPLPRVAAVLGEGFEKVQGIGQLTGGRICLVGRLTADIVKPQIRMTDGSLLDLPVLEKKVARRGRLLATCWAASRVDQIASDADGYEDELLGLGRRYGLVSPKTSLLVLESLDQWVRYGIEPPAMLPEMRAQWQQLVKSQRETEVSESQRHQAVLERNWAERKAWWARDFEKEPYKDVVPRRDVRANVVGAAPTEDGAPVPPTRRASFLGRVLGSRTAEPAAVDGAVVMESQAVAADVLAEEEPAEESGFNTQASGGVQAAITIQPWSPDTPYLKALKAAKDTEWETVYDDMRQQWSQSPAFFLDCAGFFFEQKRPASGLRILSNLAEMKIEDPGLLRVFAWRLNEAGEYRRASEILRRVIKLREEEGQSYRDLALVLAELGKHERDKGHLEEAAKLFEKVAMTPWNRHAEVLSFFALEELNALIAWVAAQKWPEDGRPEMPKLAERLSGVMDTDVRIVLSWDADDTDIDLHVIEPSLEEAYYGHRRTRRGGLVSWDVTDGYGPEEYWIRKASKGVYQIRTKYFASHQQTVVGPATVTATVFTNWGRADEQRRVLSIRLEKAKERITIGEIEL